MWRQSKDHERDPFGHDVGTRRDTTFCGFGGDFRSCDYYFSHNLDRSAPWLVTKLLF